MASILSVFTQGLLRGVLLRRDARGVVIKSPLAWRVCVGAPVSERDEYTNPDLWARGACVCGVLCVMCGWIPTNDSIDTRNSEEAVNKRCAAREREQASDRARLRARESDKEPERVRERERERERGHQR